MAGDGPSRGTSFWGMVGSVMVALKLKERYDQYSTLPGEEEGYGHGPVALQTPNLDEFAVDGASLLDTQLPTSRSKRQRACCGMRWGLFWKAFGIVSVLFLGWEALRFFFWTSKPAASGVEGMPEFSTSLGCANAPHLYHGGRQDIFVPVGQNQNRGDHSMDFRGTGVGTITLAQGEAGLKDIKYELTLRTDTAELLDKVMLDYPTLEEIASGSKSSRLQLILPTVAAGASSCMRYDVTIYLPQTVKTLHVQSHTTAQVKFDPDSNFNLNKLAVSLYRLDTNNLLLPTEGIHSNKMELQISRGWLVGDISLVEDADLITQRGDARLYVHVHPSPSSTEPPARVNLLTTTGAGRADVFYVEHPGLPHRPIDATHHVSLGGLLYLTYTDSAFNGTVDFSAHAFAATGLSNALKSEPGLPYVGSQNGDDRMLVKTQGWAGLYF